MKNKSHTKVKYEITQNSNRHPELVLLMSGEILTHHPTRHSELISELFSCEAKSPHNSKPFGNEQEEMLKQVQHDGNVDLVLFRQSEKASLISLCIYEFICHYWSYLNAIRFSPDSNELVSGSAPAHTILREPFDRLRTSSQDDYALFIIDNKFVYEYNIRQLND